MRVKGTAYHARVNLLRAKLGSENVDAFLASFRAKNPDFPEHVLPTSQLPLELFLRLNDAIVEEVYGGDYESLWEIGEKSAEWSLREGPYRNLLEAKDVRRFAALAPVMYANFFDTGEARSTFGAGGVVDLWITGIPADHRHLYLEYSVVGYFRRGLELLGATVQMECVEGFSKGDGEVHYRLHLRGV